MRSRSRRGGRHRRRRWPFWGLLALCGAVLFALKRRSAPAMGSTPASGEAGSAPGRSLPADARVAWVPGPAGSVRLCERHPGQRLELIFVHGLGGRLEHWHRQLAALGPAMTGVAFDLPGHGGSDRDAAADSVQAAAASLGAAIDAAGLRRPLIVAHAWGALAALCWASARPGRARGLLLVDPPADQSRMADADVELFRQAVAEDPRGELTRFVRHSLVETDAELAESVLDDLSGTDDAVLRAGLLGSTRATPAADAESAAVPVHVAISDLGTMPQSLDRLVPSVVSWPLQDSGHWPMLTRPHRFNRLLDDVLDALRGAA